MVDIFKNQMQDSKQIEIERHKGYRRKYQEINKITTEYMCNNKYTN